MSGRDGKQVNLATVSTQIQSLSAELQSVRSERVSQSSIGGLEEVDRLVSEVSALSLEREQLQALLEALREEKAQDKIHMVGTTSNIHRNATNG